MKIAFWIFVAVITSPLWVGILAALALGGYVAFCYVFQFLARIVLQGVM